MTYPQVAEQDQPRLIITIAVISIAVFFGIIAVANAANAAGDMAFKVFLSFFGFGNAAVLWYFDLRRVYMWRQSQ